MGSHLRNAEEKQTSDDENVSKSIEEFLGIAHDLEDIVDTFVLGRTRRQRSNNGVTAPEVSEDLAVEYLEDLEKRRMVRVSRSVSDTSPKRCCITGKFYDIILPKAEQVSFFHIHKNIASSSSSTDRDHDHQSQTPPPQFAVRRVAEYANIKDYPADSELYVQCKRGYLLLTVLDLERVYKPALPEEPGYHYHLRYMGLRWTFVDALPDEIEEDLDTVRKLYQVPQKPKKVGSHRPLTAHGLGQCIAKPTSLQSLKLRSTQDDEMARPSSLHLVSLVGLKNLTKLYLLGKLANLDKDPLEFPPSLRDLTLSCSRLNVDPMLMLRRLPHLTVLRLLANSYSGSKMVSQQSEFGSLRILQLWVLEDLEGWVVEQGAMQNLQKLEIRRCHKLKSVPETLINSTTLEELTLTNMPEEFVAETQILSFKTNTWKLIIR
ncbi:hypothetical protein TB2_031413 [Malus domestica]|uniref:inactive disease susceptibility protein LOV1-like n=1 Tax=Malus domestica TaxID=3750 RepID=UPI0004989BB9|nr:putative disease resistance protein At1g50180 [Malus domestica]